MKKRFVLVLSVICILASCLPVFSVAEKSDDIVILYENDVHCAIDGYSKIAAMKTDLSEEYNHVGVVSAGDFIQGSSLGAISQGEYIVNVMNLVGYDAVTLGNHEFDYKIPRLLELVDMMDTKPVCSNFQKISESTTFFKSYSIVSYGEVDIAFVGITTPDTVTSSSPAQFMDSEGNYIYTFNGDNLYETVQKSVDDAKAEGADYVIALSHLGTESVYPKWSSQALVENTSGFDVVLDGHSHSVVEELIVKNKDGKDVIITSTGTKFANIGKLTISDGNLKTELVSVESYTKNDTSVDSYISQINEEYKALGERKIGESKVRLTTVDADGNRIIRNNETNLGDFCADAFRIVTGADVGFINGGGIRADIDIGDVTFNDILSVYPWNNRVVVAEVTGQQIVDMLELGVVNYPEEDGTFQHVSGLKFDLDKSVKSTVKFDENNVFECVEGARRVRNVKILDKTSGNYTDIDPDKKYTLASHNHLLLDLGGGASMFKDADIVSDDGMLDVELLEIYVVEYLDGVIGEEYEESRGRINIVDGSEDIPETGDNNVVAAMLLLMFLAAVVVVSNILRCKK